tara:strand:- start:2 stop:691 length:690 start_codon:yes stop_codon:yes gene_type:complete
MGAATPGKPVPGKPPKGMDEGGPKVTPAPLPPGSEGVIDDFRFPGAGGPAPTSPGRGPGLFGQLMEGIKKTDKFKNRGPGGLGGFPSDLPSKPFMGGMIGAPKPKSNYRDEIESVLRESKGSRNDDVTNKIREIEERERERRAGRSPNRFPMGGNERSPFDGGMSPAPRDPRTMRGPRKKEAVFFGERKPSSESKRPTKRGMKKAGSSPSPEAKSKFEEMLAYMKSFQR